MKCQNCGVENPEKNKFCQNCGTTIVNVPGNTNVNMNNKPVTKRKTNGLVVLTILITFALITCGTFLAFSIVKKNQERYGYNNNEYKGYQRVGSSTLGYIYIPSSWQKLSFPSDSSNSRYKDGENVLMYTSSSQKSIITMLRYDDDTDDNYINVEEAKKEMKVLGLDESDLKVEYKTVSGYRATSMTYEYMGFITTTLLFKDNNDHVYNIQISDTNKNVIKKIIDSYTLN